MICKETAIEINETLQQRRKSQLITFSASSNDIKNHINGGRLSFAEKDSKTQLNTELEDEVFHTNSLEVDQGVVGDVDMDEDLFEDELLYCGTHISSSHNANDDSGGGSGSYEDSHALHSSLGGSNRNSLEKDDDDDMDVISTDVSCYDQLVGSMKHEENDIKIYLNGKINANNDVNLNGSGVGHTIMKKAVDGAGAIYANPFMGL